MIFLLLPHISFALWSHFRLLMQPDASWIIWLHAKCHFPVISVLIQSLLQFNIIQWLNQDQLTSLHLWGTILLWRVIMYKNGSIILTRYPVLILMAFQFPSGMPLRCCPNLAGNSSLAQTWFEELSPTDCSVCSKLCWYIDRWSK